MIKEHDRVLLTGDLPRDGLKAGDVGTVVHIHTGGEAMEVEFVALDGETVAVVTAAASDVRPIRRREIPHARPIAAV
jgi:hypothetical protein